MGLWHGLIVPISFIASLFHSEVSVYATPNSGLTYNLGFALGVVLDFFGTKASN